MWELSHTPPCREKERLFGFVVKKGGSDFLTRFVQPPPLLGCGEEKATASFLLLLLGLIFQLRITVPEEKRCRMERPSQLLP